MGVRNRDLVELLARAAEREVEHRARVLRRASRFALMWPVEAASLLEEGRSLTELPGVGPWIARTIHEWLEAPPDVPDPPADRANFLTLADAREVLSSHPDRRSWLLGDLQMHTTWSDGKAPLEEMAAAAAALGHRYVGVTDHSKGLPIARGMDEAKLLRQMEAIGAYNEDGAPLRILRSLEMNLSPEGDGDMDPAVLRRLDLVLGAFHSQLRVASDQTERYLAALRNPTIHVLAHPRGRRFGTRPGLRADWPRVFAAAAEEGVALEIDCHSHRQDLEVGLLALAADAGAWISVGTDAHSPVELESIELGVAATVLGGVPRERILNCMDADELLAWAGRRSSG